MIHASLPSLTPITTSPCLVPMLQSKSHVTTSLAEFHGLLAPKLLPFPTQAVEPSNANLTVMPSCPGFCKALGFEGFRRNKLGKGIQYFVVLRTHAKFRSTACWNVTVTSLAEWNHCVAVSEYWLDQKKALLNLATSELCCKTGRQHATCTK